jgi:predicted GTPase
VTQGDALRRYEEARDEIVARLLRLEELVEDERRAETIRGIRARLERGRFVLAVVGEFSSGKSFLLNALLGKFQLLATDINPSTATITELEHGERDEAIAFYEDGRSERVALDSLNRFVAEPSIGSEQRQADAPARVVVRTDSAFLKRGFMVADTPGLASINPSHRRASLAFLPAADAVLYLIDTQQPFTEGDASFLGIIRSHIDSIFIVQTKIDLWREPHADGRAEWEHAYDRIVSLAAVHAPGTFVYALSARDYVEGTTAGDAALIEASRFDEFLRGLDDSLVRHTGFGRLRRARDLTSEQIADARTELRRDLSTLALDRTALDSLRSTTVPRLDEMIHRAAAEREKLLGAARETDAAVRARGTQLGCDLSRALEHAFDAADISRLRDRAKLHSLVDQIFAQIASGFSDALARDIDETIASALQRVKAILPLRWSANDAAANAFGGTPGSGHWSGELSSAISSTIVLDALGGPAISVVHDVATRFSARPAGSYMKRELTADLRSQIVPRLHGNVAAFTQRVATKTMALYEDLGRTISASAHATRERELGGIERAVQAHRDGTVATARFAMERRYDALDGECRCIEEIVERFAREDEALQRSERAASNAAATNAVLLSHADASFDPNAYNRGLRPSRWRVAILGALRRGKTSLINAFAGRPVLTDDVAGSARFPIHVRYGDRDQAFALGEDGDWAEVAFEDATAHAAQAPVLVLVPWSLPHELVLVHVPAFDSGDSPAEDVNAVVASHANEILCLFSRQLSDRELALYERVADFGKPMLFAHTIADNEGASERRHVAELAKQYLQERKIPAQRVFVISAREYAEAKRAKRASAGWNETEALRSTLESHAEEHMARLERLARSTASAAASPNSLNAPRSERSRQGLLSRFFGKGG